MPFDSLKKTPIVRLESVNVASLFELKQALSIDFTDHDDRLQSLLESARCRVENLTSLSLNAYTITIKGLKDCKGWELPYSPIVGDVTINSVVNTVDLSGESEKVFINGLFDVSQVSYQVGYTSSNVPADLKEAVIVCAIEMFRAEKTDWRKIASPYAKHA